MRGNIQNGRYRKTSTLLWMFGVAGSVALLLLGQPAAAMNQAAMAPTQDSVSVTELNIVQGKSNVVNLKTSVSRVSVGNPAVAGVNVLSPRQIYVLGKTVGSTNVMLWDRSKHIIAVFDVYVTREVGLINQEIRKVENGGHAQVRAVGNTMVLEGQVPDARTAAKVADLANAFSSKKVVNMLTVEGVQQVILAVKIAEINRTLADRLGVNLNLNGSIGIVNWNFLSQFTGTTTDSNGNVTQNPGQLTFSHSGSSTPSVGIDAQKGDGLVKILAEPNIVAMSGQEGSFLAGGEILIPVASTQGAVTLETKQFGVGLRFTPTVLEDGRINMRVVPDVTEVTGFQNVNVGNNSAVVPVLTTRRASTTVELRDGQSLAIGGLLQDNVKEAINRLPVLGEIPVLGALFRSSEYQTDRTELLIVVTPHLIKPIGPNYRLPTDDFKEPSRSEFFLEGRMEGKPAAAKPTTAQPAASQPAAEQPAAEQGAAMHELK